MEVEIWHSELVVLALEQKKEMIPTYEADVRTIVPQQVPRSGPVPRKGHGSDVFQ